MHIDSLGVLQYRIRKLEIVLEIIKDAEACAGIYAKANLTRGIMERMLELAIADESLPGLVLLVANHHGQDLKFLRRTERTETDAKALAVVRHNIAETIRLRDKALADAAAVAQTLDAASRPRQTYEALLKNDSVEARAQALFPPATAAAFYGDYAALSQFVHGGNRETLVVTANRGDLAPILRPLADASIAQAKASAEAQLAILRGQPAPAPAQTRAPPGYDATWHFRRIASDNWLNADVPSYFPGTRPSAWINTMLAPQLAPHLPLEIVRLFEVARGALVYSWFFYPLATLAAEQSHRVVEAAVKLRCCQLGKAARNFSDGIKVLTEAGIISAEEWTQWDATRAMRNAGSHPETQTIWDPGQSVQIFQMTADMLNKIFPEAAQSGAFHAPKV
jgi:hypothetical protein